MMRIKPLTWLLMIVALALSGSFIFTSTVRAVFDEGQNALSSRSAQPRERGATEMPDLDDLKAPPSEMRSILERYSVDRGTINRSGASELSPSRQNRLKQFYSEWLVTIGRLDFEAMSQDGKVEYLLFKNHLDYELRQLELQAKALAEVAPFLPFAQTIIELDEARRRMELVDSSKVAALMNNLNKQIEAVRRNLEAQLRTSGRAEGDAQSGHLKKTVANRAAATTNMLRNTLRNWFGFYNGYDPMFTWWVDAPYRQVDQSLQRHADFLRERIAGLRPATGEAGGATLAAGPPFGGLQGRGAPGAGANPARGDQGGPGGQSGPGGRPGRGGGGGAEPGSSDDIVGDPIGREALMVELAREMIPYTPEELVALANRELAWCENEMKKASRELGHGDDWMKALEYVKTLYVEPGKQPQLIRDLALEALKFMDDHDLVTVPALARESWRMEMMSPERQLVNPFFTGGETISVSYPTNTMSHEQKMMSMRGNNPHFSRATVHHELIPGHHLQGFMTARYKPYRGLFSTPFWGEGWSLYWELLLWDMNFPKTPENRIGMLFWRMHRCARIIFSLSFHLGQMTPQQCIDLLVKRVGHEVDNATAEVRRSFAGNYGPLYQAAYLLGGLQFYALHKELVDSGRMANRAFHDQVLKENRIPVEMVRAILTKQKLTRDFKSSWKFYGPNPGGR